MTESETHVFQLPCKKELTVIKDGTHYRLVAGNPGETCHMFLEVVGNLVSEIPKERQLKILKGKTVHQTDPNDNGYICEKGIAGNKGCIHRFYKFLRDGK